MALRTARAMAMVITATFGLVVIAPLNAADTVNMRPGYYRYPAIHGDTIIFTAEGDLWTVSVKGGAARRLTSNPGRESGAAISPDGKTVAFSAEYEGPTDVYTMPVEGGLPQRRTWDGDAAVAGWTPDGRVLVRTHRYSTLPDPQLVAIDSQRPARDGASGAGGGRQLHAGRPHAVLHALRPAGEPHQALPGRHGGEHLALRRRLRGRAADRRLARHLARPDVLERTGLLPFRPRRRDERLFDGPRRARPEAAHAPPRLRCSVGVALRMAASCINAAPTSGCSISRPVRTPSSTSRWSPTSISCAITG